jgi:hypothetical protein
MKSPALHMFYHVVFFLSALGALHVGLLAMGYNVLGMPFLMNLAKPIEYIFGLAGLISLVLMIFMHSMVCNCSGCPRS